MNSSGWSKVPLHLVGEQPVLPLRARQWDEDADHLLLDPVSEGWHAFFALSVAAAQGDDLVCARAAMLLEVGKDFFEALAVGFAE